MTDDTTLQKEITSLLFQNLNVEVPSAQEDLIDSGLLDSLKIVELLVELENRFVLKIPFEELDIECFRSVESIARLIAHLCLSTEMVNAAASATSNRVTSFLIAD